LFKNTFIYELPGTQEKYERENPEYKEGERTLRNKVVLLRKAGERLDREKNWTKTYI